MSNPPKSMLAGVTRGPLIRPHFVLLYGVDGVGKSSFGAAAPNPIFLGPEDGTGHLDVTRFPATKTLDDVKLAINDLLHSEHDYKTLVIDSVDWMEPVVWAAVCAEAKVSSIEDVDGGFGKGYVRALEEWQELIKLLQRLRAKMNVVAIAHAQIKPFDDPAKNEKYDRYLLKMNEKASALWREAVDCVIFANFQTTTSKRKGESKARAFGDGTRIMFTERRPAFDAKNRFNLPFEMALDWKVFSDAVAKNAAAAATAKPVDEIAAVTKLIAGREEAVMAYLVAHEWLDSDQTIADLAPSRRATILAKAENFLAAVDAHKNETTNTAAE